MLKKIRGPFIVILVGVIPACLLLIGSPETINLYSAAPLLDFLGRVAGLSALSLLALNIILSARLGVFDRLFLGMDRAYRFHRIIGGSVLILVLVHAMFITAKYSSISLLSAYEFLKPNLDIALMAGKFALAVILVGVFMSMYLTIKYKLFITIQRLLGAVIFIGGYHALFVTGTNMQTNGLLMGYFIIIGGLAAGLYIYRSVFHKSVKRQLMYAVESVTTNENIAQIWLRPLGKTLAFYAGQFGFYRFHSMAVDTESHPFSISSGSDDGRLRLSVKGVGDYTKALQSVMVGDTVSIEGPYGNFSFTKIQSYRQVWIAGGIGITPFLAMAQSLPAGYDVTLFYCTKTVLEAKVFLNELEYVTARNPGFRVVTVSDDQQQRLSIDMVKQVSAADYLLCAPLGMMENLKKQLIDAGVSGKHVYYEEFRLK
jgi:predicted ferric reductase